MVKLHLGLIHMSVSLKGLLLVQFFSQFISKIYHDLCSNPKLFANNTSSVKCDKNLRTKDLNDPTCLTYRNCQSSERPTKPKIPDHPSVK